MSLVIILVVSGITAVVMNFFIKQFILHNKEQEMIRQGERVAKSVVRNIEKNRIPGTPGMPGTPGSPGVQPPEQGVWVFRTVGLIREIEGVLGGRIWLMDGNGVIYTNAMPLRQLNDKELAKMKGGQRISQYNWSDELDKPILAVAIPITMQGEMVGGVFIVIPMKDVKVAQNQVRRVIFISALLGGIIAVLFAFYFSRHVTRPLLDMQELITRMRQGDFSGQLTLKRDDELGQLAEHFNDLNLGLKETIDLLSAEKEKTQRIINSMAEGVISLNGEGEIILMNPVARRTLQIHLREKVGAEALVNLPGLVELAKQVQEENLPLNRELEYHGKVLSVTASPVRSPEGSVGVVLILQDITNRWRLVQLQKELVANVSHEFKTPLTSIKGFVELMLDNKISDPEIVKNSLKIIHSETLRLTRMVSDLLRMARLEVLRLKKEPVDLYELVDKVVEVLEVRLEEAQVKVQLHPTLKNTVCVDQDRMEQVFYNLLDNAIRFSPAGSTIEVDAEDKGILLEIRVRDRGPGVPDSEQDLIFDRFYKIEKARSNTNTGFGLGLTIVKDIITEHGGKIWVSNHSEGGAVFTLQLVK